MKANLEQQNWTDFASEIEEVELDLLEPSPFNTRVIREDDKLRELAESIRLLGVNQPIIMRHVPIEGDVVKFEIVVGHRRVAASKLAGKKTIPAITRDLSDDEARKLQIIENLQREDLAPLDEARAFSEAMTFDGEKMLTVQELAARLGKSPVYINRRLTLLDAIPTVQEALSKGLIEVGHALEMARLSEAEQIRLLVWMNVGGIADDVDDEDEDDQEDLSDLDPEFAEDDQEAAATTVLKPTSTSVVELRKHIASTTLRVLGDAPFDTNDPSLVEDEPSCVDCLKRSGSSPLLFNDVAGDDICTDRDCYNSKVKAHVALRLAAAKEANSELAQITEAWSKKGAGIFYEHHVTIVPSGSCKFAVEAIRIDGREAGETVHICHGGPCKVHGRGLGGGSRSVPSEKEKANRKALLAKVKIEKAYRFQLMKELLAKPLAAQATDDMVRELVIFALGRMDSTKHKVFAEVLGWDERVFGWSGKGAMLARLAGLTQAEAIRVALVALEAGELTVHEHAIGSDLDLGLVKVAKLIGVDSAAVRAKATPKPEPKKAAKKPAKKAAKKKAKRNG